MSRRSFTFLVLSSDSSKTRRFCIPARALKAAGVAFAVLVVAIGFIVSDYIRLKRDTAELYSLKKENEDHIMELQGFSAKIRYIEDKLSRLNIFDKKLRSMAFGSPKGDKPEQVMGMGGKLSDDEYPVSRADARSEEVKERLHGDMMRLDEKARTQEESFNELYNHLLKNTYYIGSVPSIWPVRGWVTSPYGERISPFSGSPQIHSGIDIANNAGTPVVASADGVVVEVAREEGLGKKISLAHGYGIKTIYGHLSDVFVKPGQKVKRGAKIAAVGNSGRSTGPHLHYEISLNGVSVDPAKYLLN